VHHHAGRFVDRNYVVILIENFERQILGGGTEWREIGRIDLDLLAAFQLKRTLRGCSIHVHKALIDPRLQARPAVLRELIAQELVQALSGVRG
jgi:hypothetical protein